MPFIRVMRYCSGVSWSCHSASVFCIFLGVSVMWKVYHAGSRLLRRRTTHFRALSGAEEGGYLAEDAPVSVDEGDVWGLHLAVAAFPTELAHGLDDQEQPVHARVIV